MQKKLYSYEIRKDEAIDINKKYGFPYKIAMFRENDFNGSDFENNGEFLKHLIDSTPVLKNLKVNTSIESLSNDEEEIHKVLNEEYIFLPIYGREITGRTEITTKLPCINSFDYVQVGWIYSKEEDASTWKDEYTNINSNTIFKVFNSPRDAYKNIMELIVENLNILNNKTYTIQYYSEDSSGCKSIFCESEAHYFNRRDAKDAAEKLPMNIEDMELVKRYTYKVKSEELDHPRDPNYCENFGRIICFHKNYIIGDKHEYHTSEELIEDLTRWYIEDDCRSVYELTDDEKREILDKHYIWLPVYAYEHGGLSINTTGFSCRWDSGKVGITFISISDAISYYKSCGLKIPENIEPFKEECEKRLDAEVEELNRYFSGVCDYTAEIFCNNEFVMGTDLFYSSEDAAKAAERIIEDLKRKDTPNND